MSNNKTYKDKLQFKINFVFGIALTITLLAIVAIGIWLTSKELIAKDRHLIEKIGESIVLNLEKQTLFAENVVATEREAIVATTFSANRVCRKRSGNYGLPLCCHYVFGKQGLFF